MAITKDRSDLPPGDKREGIVPDADSPVVDAVITGLRSHINAERSAMYGVEVSPDGQVHRPTSREGAVFRHSDAAGCARQLGYKMAGVEPTNPPTDTDLINMWWGTVIHDQVDKGLVAAGWPEGAVEVPCGFDDPVVTAGTADGFHNGVCLETKSVGGYKYKLAVGERGQAAGPDWSAIVQGALNATALDAESLVILDVSKELISKGIADKKGIPDVQRGIASWTYTPDQFRPLAERELKRVRRVHELVVAGEPVPAAIADPEVPSAARVVDPSTGRWEVRRADGSVSESGTYWGCSYCWHRSKCAEDMAAERAAAA